MSKQLDDFKNEWQGKKLDFTAFFSKNPKTISNSRANTLLECSLKHFMIYCEGMRIDKDVVGINLGKSGHMALEYYHKGPDNIPSTIRHHNAIECFENIWKNVDSLDLATSQAGRTTTADNKIIASNLIDQYITNHEKIAANDDYRLVQYQFPGQKDPYTTVEMPFRIPIIDLNTGATIVPDYDLIGVIDLIELYNNTAYIMDHKFLAIKPKEFFFQNDIQLVLYAYAFRFLAKNRVFLGITDETPSLVGFNWLLKPYKGWGGRKNPKYERITKDVSIEEINGVLNLLGDAIYNFENGKPVPSYPESCGWKCDLKEPCKAHRFMKNRLEAFEKEHGFKPTIHSYTNKKPDQTDLF